jgi:hypothetical protein
VSIFSNDKTPWGSPGEVVVWVVGMTVSAFLIHNMIRVYKKRK